MTTLKATMRLSIQGSIVAAIPGGEASVPIVVTRSDAFADGAGANQANKWYAASRTLAGGANEDLDLNGVLTDALANVLSMTGIKALVIEAVAANSGNVVVGGAASNAFATIFGDATDKLVLPPGAFVAFGNPSAAGYVVTANTGDQLRVANAHETLAATYRIYILAK